MTSDSKKLREKFVSDILKNIVRSTEDYNEANRCDNIRIKKLLTKRNASNCFILQCGCDREVQIILKSFKSIEYDFNKEVLHKPKKYFLQGPDAGPGSIHVKGIAPDFAKDWPRHQSLKEEGEEEKGKDEEDVEEDTPTAWAIPLALRDPISVGGMFLGIVLSLIAGWKTL